jgi:hypothetical protein
MPVVDQKAIPAIAIIYPLVRRDTKALSFSVEAVDPPDAKGDGGGKVDSWEL